VPIETGCNGSGTSHGGLLMPHAASSSQREAEEMADASFSAAKLVAARFGCDLQPCPQQTDNAPRTSFSAAKFVAPVAARSGCDLLPCPSSSTADRQNASVPSLRSHSTSFVAGERSHSLPTLRPTSILCSSSVLEHVLA
jgi:hypothetical protein